MCSWIPTVLVIIAGPIGYHPSGRQQRQVLLDQHFKDAFAARKERSGLPMITLDLEDEGQSYNPKTVAVSIQRQGFSAKAAKMFKATTNSNHELPVDKKR